MPSVLARLRSDGLTAGDVAVLVMLMLALCAVVVVGSQWLVDREPLLVVVGDGKAPAKEQVELAKLAAEVRHIRGDTSGGQFWLKVVGLFVTVGGAIGGYLIGQERTTRARKRLEDRRTIDGLIQSIVQELASDTPLLRAAAAVKLGELLHAFPSEWQVSEIRRAELVALAKRVLAAALALEKDEKVLKTLSIAIARHRLAGADAAHASVRCDMRELDLSGANARDAYWARVDLSYCDFFKADLSKASLRNAVLRGGQFRETKMNEAVLNGADAESAVFKFADLRGADLRDVNLRNADFTGAKVYGARIDASAGPAVKDAEVDLSPDGDGSRRCRVADWVTQGV